MRDYDPIYAIPGSNRYVPEVEIRRQRLDRQVAGLPDDVWLQGTLAAARWTMGEVDQPPLSAQQDRTAAGYRAELELARSVHLGLRDGDRERAAGAREWLEWWLA